MIITEDEGIEREYLVENKVERERSRDKMIIIEDF
jgi:hypothetical protein